MADDEIAKTVINAPINFGQPEAVYAHPTCDFRWFVEKDKCTMLQQKVEYSDGKVKWENVPFYNPEHDGK